MNTNTTARNLFATGILASMLVACGGGGSESVSCPSNVNPAFCAAPPAQATGQTPGQPLGQTPGGQLPGQSPTVISLAPSALTVGNCTTRVPFIFSGGVGPYTIITSENFLVPVSTALSLDDSRSYFFADIRYPRLLNPADEKNAVALLTVLDSEARTAVASVTTPLTGTQNLCPANPLLKVLPETANFRTSEILAFQVSGGPAPAAVPTVTFADAGVAEVVTATAATVTVRAVATAKATTLMTVATADGQRSSVVIIVLPQP